MARPAADRPTRSQASRRQREAAAEIAPPPARRPAPTPRKPNRLLLAASVAIFAVWLLFLVVLAAFG